ncbi:MAG: NAD-dependent epimerase/dehydratase family protein, partial [Armatimonadetes bacterium]|nr:NAD-dependent epimerase/dehydratase family protein [Armatimonadota bacterium]
VGGVSRVVYFSTVAVYGEATPPEGITEDAPPAPVTPYAETKLRGETLVTDWATRTGKTSVILRLATVYGARDRGNMARMADAVRRGRFVLPGSGANRKTIVAVETVAQIAVNAAFSEDVPNGLPVVVADAGGAVTLREIALDMARAAGVPDAHALRSVPLPVLRVAATIIESAYRVARPGKSPPITATQVERLAADNVYLTERMTALLAPHAP